MSTSPIRAVITGATGMVGEGVLMECLNNPMVEAVLVVTRRPLGMQHPKLREVVHANFFSTASIAHEFKGYNACYFCLGVSSLGMNERDYTKATHTLTTSFAREMAAQEPGIAFCYVSGAGTDSTEAGRNMWARVKGKTENDLMKMPFRKVFAFRPGFIKPAAGQSKTHNFYKYIGWMFPLGRKLYPKGFCTMNELAKAMIEVTANGYEKTILEGNDIIALGAHKM